VVHARDRSLLLAPVAAIGWLGLAFLGLVVKLALFRFHRTHGATAVLWGLGFGLFLWAGSLSVGLELARAILFGLVAGVTIALLVYVRGAGLEGPPAAQPWASYRRRRPQRSADRPTEARDIHRVRVALVDDDREEALFYLREAEKVAVAQGKAEELEEVHELQRSLGVEVPVPAVQPPFPEVLEPLRRQAAAGHGSKTRELMLAPAALEAGDFEQALFMLREACHVAVAQRRLGELLEVHDLVQALYERSSGRTRTAAEALARQVEAGFRSFASASCANQTVGSPSTPPRCIASLSSVLPTNAFALAASSKSCVTVMSFGSSAPR
jgi:hypothetical protein